MRTILKISVFLILLVGCAKNTYDYKIIQEYQLSKKDSLRIGIDEKDFLPFIEKGYTLMLPEDEIKGVLIFLEDSGFDKKNKKSKQMYNQASKNGFAVLSVSSEVPFDFYFLQSSILSTHKLIKQAFTKHNLLNKNVFFLGGSLIGHRAMRYIKFTEENNTEFKLKTKGIVICNFTLDWTRKWYQHQREIKINRNNLWEPTFINYMLETYLNGTPKTTPNNYHNFSAYSYFDEQKQNIKIYKNLAVRAYVEPLIKYKLVNQLKTLYENNTIDIVGFLAELELAGNKNTELIVLQSQKNSSDKKTAQGTWDIIDKKELMSWIVKNIQ